MVVRSPFVHEAELRLAGGTDPGAPGAAVTTELCGHWQHEGGCRWPHNNELRATGDAAATFRTVFVAPPEEEDEVRRGIERALRSAAGWTVMASSARSLRPEEQPLAAKLANSPLP